MQLSEYEEVEEYEIGLGCTLRVLAAPTGEILHAFGGTELLTRYALVPSAKTQVLSLAKVESSVRCWLRKAAETHYDRAHCCILSTLTSIDQLRSLLSLFMPL